MVKARRLRNQNAGFIYDISKIIAIESWKNPSMIPDLSRDRSIFVFSDYSSVQGMYKTYSYLIIGRSSADYFNGARVLVRKDFHLVNRKMAYKGLNDKIKLKALPAFLSCAGAMEGIIMTFAVDSQIQYLFVDQFLTVWPELADIKRNTLEDMLRIIHFGAVAITSVFSSGQRIIWFTDSDAVVTNETHQQIFGSLAETTIRKMFMPDENIPRIIFGLSDLDDGSLEIEDFLSVPDLIAGALCETLENLKKQGLRIFTKIILMKPDVRDKTNIICEWIGKTACPLKKIGIVIDKDGTEQSDFRPTLFTIQNLKKSTCETSCNARPGIKSISVPVRFDIER